jgi:hypothetical protein
MLYCIADETCWKIVSPTPVICVCSGHAIFNSDYWEILSNTWGSWTSFQRYTIKKTFKKPQVEITKELHMRLLSWFQQYRQIFGLHTVHTYLTYSKYENKKTFLSWFFFISWKTMIFFNLISRQCRMFFCLVSFKFSVKRTCWNCGIRLACLCTDRIGVVQFRITCFWRGRT